jgi:5'-nucleotidase
MNILASNDDGIKSDGLILLVKALRAEGHHVLIIAPDRNRSGASHSITFDMAIPLVPVGEDAYSYGGTPVDCVLAALIPGGLGYQPDVIVSGINAGANLGTDILYSGTAAVARQGSLYDIPSIAFSVDGDPPYCFAEAAHWSAVRFGELLTHWRAGTFINVNYPNSRDFSDYVFTYPALRLYDDSIRIEESVHGTRLYALGSSGARVRQKSRMMPGISDCDAVSDNKVSVSLVYNHPRVVETMAE